MKSVVDQNHAFQHNRGSQKNGVLAQLVEQRTFNPFVVGSIPAHPTNKIKGLCLRTGLCAFLVCHKCD